MSDDLANNQQTLESSYNDTIAKIRAIIGSASFEQWDYDRPTLRCAIGCGVMIWYMPETWLKEELWQLRNELKLKAAPELLELTNKLFEDFHFDLHYENAHSALELDSFELLELGIKVLNLFNSLEKYEEVELNGLTLELAKIADEMFDPVTVNQLFAQRLPHLTREEASQAVDRGMLHNNDIYIPIRSDSKMLVVTAVQSKDIQQVTSLLDNGENVNQKVIYGATPLYIAAQNEDIAMVELLIANGANVNAALYNGATPLLVAIEKGNIDVIKFLVANGADVNQSTIYETTPLLSALGEKLIIDNESVSESINRLVKWFGYKANPEIVDFLLASGANVNYDPSDELLNDVVKKNDRAIIELFIKHCVERDSKIPGKEACLATLNEFEEFAAVLSSCKMEGEYSIDCSSANTENVLLGVDPASQEVA